MVALHVVDLTCRCSWRSRVIQKFSKKPLVHACDVAVFGFRQMQLHVRWRYAAACALALYLGTYCTVPPEAALFVSVAVRKTNAAYKWILRPNTQCSPQMANDSAMSLFALYPLLWRAGTVLSSNLLQRTAVRNVNVYGYHNLDSTQTTTPLLRPFLQRPLLRPLLPPRLRVGAVAVGAYGV